MGKKLRFMVIAAAMALFSTSAFAEEASSDSTANKTEERVSANGSYQFKLSWGVGLQYGLTFTDMANWNDYLLVPSKQNYFDVNFVAEHELYVEVTPVEGFRLSAFGGFQSLYISDTGFNYGYAGLEPAFSVRRSFYEFAVGIGIGYGKSWLDSSVNSMDGHGLLVRPFVEARFYPCDIFALYLRVAFSYFKDFGMEATDYSLIRDVGNEINTDKLSYAGPNVSVGVRFGNYESPVVVIPDTDGDGILDDIDDCVELAGTKEFHGCTNPDTDGDGYCDPWVSENGLDSTFESVCKGSDKCAEEAEDKDGFQDDDGCVDADNDADGLCDSWVSEKGLAEKYAGVCKNTDKCNDEAEDLDGYQDEDGCADPDNDGDGLCDSWVSEKGLSEKYAATCKAVDVCTDEKGSAEFKGCVNPDPDGDAYCDPWVYDKNLQSNFPECKGKDMCLNEKGDDDKGCTTRRVVVTEDKIEIKDKIYFALNKATIKKESDSLLEEIASVIKENPRIKKIEIQGHTDLSGNAKKNQKLSQDRAKSVYSRLVKLGVEKDRLTYKGYGMSQPLIPLAAGEKKESEEAAATNRRVDFVILEQDEVKKVVTVSSGPAPAAPATDAKPATISRTEAKALGDAKKAEADAKKAAADAKAKAEADKKAADEAAKKAAADAKAKAEADKKAAEDALKKAAADAKAKAEADKKAAEDALKKAAADAKAKAEADKKAAADAKAKAEADKKAVEDAAKKAAADAKAKAEADKKAAEDALKKAAADAKAKAEADKKAAEDAAKKAAADAKAKAEADKKAAEDAAKKAAADAAAKAAAAQAAAKAAAAQAAAQAAAAAAGK